MGGGARNAPNAQEKFEAAERVRLAAEVQERRRAVAAAQAQVDRATPVVAAAGRGLGSANTGNWRVDFGLGALGAVLERNARTISHVVSGVEEQKLKLGQAQGTLDFYNRYK